MNDEIQYIVDNKIPCYFISPHLDDAVLSCGALISYLHDKTSVAVFTVFTKISPPPYTFSAKTFIRQCGFDSAEGLFQMRRQEDEQAFRSIGVRTKHWGYVDASWRKKDCPRLHERFLGSILPEFLHVYPTYRWQVISGRVSEMDEKIADSMKQLLQKEIDRADKICVFCPMAIGGHVDHALVRKCVTDVYGDVVLWADFPYNSRESSFIPPKNNGERFVFQSHKEEKKRLIQEYRTQYDAMFGKDGLVLLDEEYMHSVK